MKRHGVGIADRLRFRRAPHGFAIALGLFVVIRAAAAQDPESDHSAHHPPDAAVPETAAPKAAVPTATPVAAPAEAHARGIFGLSWFHVSAEHELAQRVVQ